MTSRAIPCPQVKAEFPPEWQTSGMLLLSTAMSSIGRTAGSLFGGFFMAHGTFLGYTGGRALYAGAAVTSSALIAAHAVVTLALRASGRRGLVETPPPATCPLEPLIAPAPAAAHSREIEREIHPESVGDSRASDGGGPRPING